MNLIPNPQAKKKGNTKAKAKPKAGAAPRLKMKIQKMTAALDTSVFDFNDDETDSKAFVGKVKGSPGRGLKTSPLGVRLSPQAKLKQGPLKQESPIKSETKGSPGSTGGSPVKSPKVGDGPLTGAELAARVAGLKASAGLKLKVHNGKIIR